MIKIFTTGGTIDTEVRDGKYILERTLVPEMLKQGRVELKTSVKPLFRKGSSEITEKDKKLILKKCKDCKEEKIIITHGTNTMSDTARYLGKRIKDKTIVLTGSFVPYSQKNSDALFNLGSALSLVQELEKGVYITINGQLFKWNNVRKNEKKQKFEKIVSLAGISVIKDYSINESTNENKLFQLASISKCLTSFCVMKLVEKGKISLNEDVNNYLKSWKVKDREGKVIKVTLKQLLSHTAGISCPGFGGYNDKQKIPTLNQILEAKEPANSEEIYYKYKKDTYNHSGGGYVIIQKVLEDILGKKFSRVMEEEVLNPLGMKKSTFNFPKSKNFAKGYLDGRKVDYHFYPEKAAAGLWSTPGEISKFLIEVQKAYHGKSDLLSKKMARKMLNPVIEAEGNYMALGFFISKNKKYFYHAGHNVGFRCKYFADFNGNGIVVLTNEENSDKFIDEFIKKKKKNLK